MSTPTKAIFLSYASQDAGDARRICDDMRMLGLEVWFDQSELRGGDAWDSSIKTQIRECALFVPIISAHTEAREEGYFRREWNLAVNRTMDMAHDKAFLVPILLNAMPGAIARVPDRFCEVQWTRLTSDEASVAFGEQVQRLLSGVAAPANLQPFTSQCAGALPAPASTTVSIPAIGTNGIAA